MKSVQMYGYLPYLLIYGAMLLMILTTRWGVVRSMLRANVPLIVFLAVYGATYLLAIAFYYPTSGTGTARFLLAHLTPLFFALSCLFSREQLTRTWWRRSRTSKPPGRPSNR